MGIFNDDEVKGNYEKAKGTVKDKVGEWTDNPDLEAEGESQRAAGETQKDWGKFKEASPMLSTPSATQSATPGNASTIR